MNDNHSSLLIVIAPPASSQPQQQHRRSSPPPPPLPPRSYAKKLPRTEQAEKTLKLPAPDPDPIRTPENPNKWRGRSVDSGSKRIPQQPGNSKSGAEQRESTTKKRGSYGGGGDAPSAARRHTTPEMAASAAYGMVLCGSDELEHRYRGRIEKVKFGVPISEAFAHDIPATLLVLLLKVNKEGPLKKDIWRAPGNQAHVRKLSHIMQHGRLVNISNISVYTAASVIKRFLAKLPGGILGADNERQLFDAAEQMAEEQQRELFYRIVDALPVPSQHLLVLLFGTFHVITDQQGEAFGTRMTPDAIGISVAPSLFHTCIHDGQRAKLEDIKRFKLASQVISRVIAAFGQTTLFPRECYEFYARITGRTMRVDEHWNFSFQLPSRTLSHPSIRFEHAGGASGSRSPTGLLEELEQQPTSSKRAAEEAALASGSGDKRASVATTALSSASEFCEDEDVYGESLPELGRYAPHRRQRETSRSLEESRAEWKAAAGMARRQLQQPPAPPHDRLSTSMGEVVVHSEEESDTGAGGFGVYPRGYLDSTRSLTYLEWVHERQTKRMRTRSEWFLAETAPAPKKNGGGGAAQHRSSEQWLTQSRRQRQQRQMEGGRGGEPMTGVSSSGEEEMSCEEGGGHGCGGPGGCPATGGHGCDVVSRSTTTGSSSKGCSSPHSCGTTSGGGADAAMKSATATTTEEEESDDDAFLATVGGGECSPGDSFRQRRQPFQLLQERQYSTSTTEGSGASAQATPSATDAAATTTCGKNGGRQRFFGSGEQEGGLQALPELAETSPQARRYSAPFVEPVELPSGQAVPGEQPQSAGPCPASAQPARTAVNSSSSGSSSGTGSAHTVIGMPRGGGVGSGVGGAGDAQQQRPAVAVVRKRSWRLHYTRPKNKSLEYETGNVREEVAPSSHSTPMRRSPPPPAGWVFSRRHSSSSGNGGGNGAEGGSNTAREPASGPARQALVRRKSSNNGGGAGAKSKIPVQSRRSTQI